MVRIFFTTFDTVCTLGSYFGVFFDLVYIKLKVKRTQNYTWGRDDENRLYIRTHTHTTAIPRELRGQSLFVVLAGRVNGLFVCSVYM